MNRSTLQQILVGSLISLLGGCVTVPHDARFSDVQQTVLDRTGKRIQWNQGTADDARVAAAVHDLLQRELTADDAVQVALLNNRHLQATYEDVGVAQAELVEAGLLKNPTLSADLRFPKYHALPYDVDVMGSFLDLLVLPLRKRAAEGMFESARLRVTHEVLNTASEVKAAFYKAQGMGQIADMRANIVHATEASFDAARRLREAGNITTLALAEERALHEQSRIELAKAERDALDAREELNERMGVWGTDTGWKLAARLPLLPDHDGPLAHLESQAIRDRADLGAMRAQVETAGQSLGLTNSTMWLADLSAGAHLSQDVDGPPTLGPAIEIPIPLFNQGQPAQAAAAARFRKASAEYVAMAVDIRAEVRRARNRMTAARDLTAYYGKVIVPLRHQIVEQQLLQFNAMQVGIFELLQSKQQEIDAGREYVQALQDYWVAVAALERAVGGRLESSADGTTQPVAAAPAPTTEPTMQPSTSDGPHSHHSHGEHP